MEIRLDSDFQSQLEILKDKLNTKESEIKTILKSQKEEYERNLKERDEEVTNFVDNLVKENLELKKTIVSLEIELEAYREKNGLNPDSDLDDKLFYYNIKQIKEINESKHKEIVEKYEKINKNFQKETKQVISNIKKIAYDNKKKNLTEENINRDEYIINVHENLISLSTLEEQLNVYENRIKLLYEELKNKEKYTIVIEQKYEMANEENKMIKRKLLEERTHILKMIDNLQNENSTENKHLMTKINLEIIEKKNIIEKEISNSLSTNQEIIKNVIGEKNKLEQELKNLRENLIKISNELNDEKEKKEKFKNYIQSKEKENEIFETTKIQLDKIILQHKAEKEILEETNKDLINKMNDSILKLNNIDSANKFTNELITKEIEKCEERNKKIIESLNNEIIAISKKLRDTQNLYDEEKSYFMHNSKKIEELNKKLELDSDTITKLSLDAGEKDTNNIILQNSFQEIKKINDKLLIKNKSLEDETTQKDNQIKLHKEIIADYEIQLISLKKENERINKSKDDNFNNFEDSKKKILSLNTEFETYQMSSKIEIQRLRNQISELEKLSEKLNKLNSVESSNTEIRKELKDLKLSISKFYKNYLSKTLNYSIGNISNIYEENKMIDEIDNSLDKLIIQITNKVKKELSNIVDANLVEKYELEIKNLKSKLGTVMQITNSVTKASNSGISNTNSNTSFKSAEKENSHSLYESLIIYLKNINIKHLLEIFQLNIQREEEIRGILTDKNYNINSAGLKSQANELKINFINLKKLCEQTFQEFQQRAKMYIHIEEFEKKLEEYRIFTQSLIDLVLDTLMNYKLEVTDAIIFKLPINDYNQFIENISFNLDNYNKKINSQIESYGKITNNVEKVVESLIKNTAIDNELLNSFMLEKFI